MKYTKNQKHFAAGVHPLIWRSWAILAAAALSLSLALAPLSVEAKDNNKDNNKDKKKKEEIYSESIYDSDGLEDYIAELAYNKKQPIQTNQVKGWPKGPVIGAAGAIIMDADSGTILYGKNIDKHLYPASITKIMTALLAYENLKPSDKITFSEKAIFGIEMGSSNIGMDVGETITVDEAMYGLMVASANEVAAALAERISGSEKAFADLMNERAVELGCKNTHFVTSNGLHKSDHYTCAHDMALIAKEVFKYPDLVNYMSQMNYHFEKTDTQPDDFWVLNTNDFLTGEIHCEDVIGGKTGYTDQARETLVTFAERDGVRLICVIMREEPPYEYYDTIDLLEYGFDHFKKINIAENEDRFLMKSPDFLSSGSDIFGITQTSCRIPDDACLSIPEKVSFSDLTAEIDSFTYEQPKAASGEKETNKDKDTADGKESENTGKSEASSEAATGAAAGSAEAPASTPSSPGEDPSHILEDGTRVLGVVHYKYNDYEIGSANVIFREAKKAESDKENTVAEKLQGIRSLFFSLVHTGAHGSVYLNVLLILPLVMAFSFILCVIFFMRELSEERKRRTRRQRQRQKAAGSSSQSQQYTRKRNRSSSSYSGSSGKRTGNRPPRSR